ncbi:MAG: ribosome biogenesis factor YjgA [Nitrospirota bacterium]
MDFKSRTQKKKEATYLQELGERLVNLSAEQIKSIDLPEEIFEAVRFAGTIKSHVARRRQMQYIGVLMRKTDPAIVQEALDRIEQGHYKNTLAFRETEKWRDELIAGNGPLIDEILARCPDADRKTMERLVQRARNEKEHSSPPGACRALFRYLKGLRTGQTDA